MKSWGIFIIMVAFTFSIAIVLLLTKQQPVETEKEDHPVWIEMMEQPGIEMEKAREAFDKYWESHEHFRGDRSKQFEQWYAINSNRLDQYGKVISAARVSSEFQKLRLNSAVELQGEWFNYGPVNVGPRNGTKRDGGRVKDIEFHPTDPNTFFVSTFKGGLFKTTDYGKSWMPISDNLTEQVYVCEVSKTYPDTILIGTDNGVYISGDGGTSWSQTGISTKTKALLIKSNDSKTIIAGSDDGIRLSTNAGATWSIVKSASKVEDLDSHPVNPQILYAATNNSPSNFFRSEDGGLTWTENTSFGYGCFMGVAVTPVQPDYVYVINLRDHLGDDSFEGFYLSEDAGLTFTKQSGQTPCISGYKSDGAISRGQPNYNLFVCADPLDANIVYAGGVKSWKSTDKGKTWTHFYEDISTDGDNIHIDQLNWAFSPHDNVIFSVNDGGVYYLNGQDKFQMITDGMPIAEIYECSQSQTVKTNVAGGTMHCGIKLNNNGIWYTPWGGDEATCIIDPTDENYVYHLKYEKISRSKNGGFNYTNIYPGLSEKGYYTGTGSLHKANPNILFAGMFEVHRTQNARDESVSWQTISSFGGSTRIQKVEQCSANHDVFYVARGSGFYRSDNVNAASPSFTTLTSGLPISGSVNDIATHPSNSDLVYILLGSKIFKSANKGQSWEDITYDLPAVALLEMIYDNSSIEGLYVGTDIGVFYKDASMTNWIDYSKNLPAIRVSGMDIYYGQDRNDSFITISTDGRGFWRSTLYGTTLQAPIAGFTADKNETLISGSIMFTGEDSQLASYEWTFEGGTPSTSIDINPRVTYTELGQYSVTLKIANSAGSDTKTQTDYISVVESSGTGSLQVQYNYNGNINDASSYIRDLSPIGAFTPTYITDKDGNMSSAFQAPGVSGKYLTAPYKGIGGNGHRTVMAWFKTNTEGTRKTIISWGENIEGKMFNLMIHEGHIRVEGGACNLQSVIGDLDDNEWHHVAVTYNPDDGDKLKDLKIYVDGVLDTKEPDTGRSYRSEIVSINTDTLTNNLRIGSAKYASAYYWIGEIDDVLIYNTDLTQAEIIEISGVVVGIRALEDKNHTTLISGKSMIVIDLNSQQSANANIYDIRGRLIKTTDLHPGWNRFALEQGIYVVRTNVDGKIEKGKVISY